MTTDYLDQITQMSRDVYERLLDAISVGRWPDGSKLTEAQRSHALQAVIAWGELHLPHNERIGYVEKSGNTEVYGDCAPLNWQGSKSD